MRISVEQKKEWLKGKIKEIGELHKDTLFSVEMPIVQVRNAYTNPTIVKCSCKRHVIHGMEKNLKCAYTEAVLESLKQPVIEVEDGNA